jgi:DNA helicase IV
MQYIKNFIKKKEQQIIGKSNQALQTLDKEYTYLTTKDTYLIYDKKQQCMDLLNHHKTISKIPWYFFWNKKLKTNRKHNLEKIQQYHIILQNYNQEFIKIKKKQYADLFKRDNLILDDDQQTAIITDDTHNLVVAGAGSGKTEVLTTRIAYLTQRKTDTIEPKRILALAFQNKAADEIQNRLKKRYNLDIEIRTFHSLGKKIINDASQTQNIKPPRLKLACSEDWKFKYYIKKLFEYEINENKQLQNQIIQFMKHYSDNFIVKNKADFKEKEEFYIYQKNLQYTTLNGTKVKSEAEREIMNFFLSHSLNDKKITIWYEEPAEWMKYCDKEGQQHIPTPDFYFPEFDIYLEHWAIGKNGTVPEWFSGDNPTEEYKKTMNIKKHMYQSHNKTLLQTSQADVENNTLSTTLSKQFLKAVNKKHPETSFNLKPLSYHQLVEQVWRECKEFIDNITNYIQRFIVISKTYRLYPSDIDKRINQKSWTPRQKTFAEIANIIYKCYQSQLALENNIDFSDMINQAVTYLKDNKELYENTYDHILIDEYQDISTQRYELIKAIMNKNQSCKLFCVGDDWQSIMGFAGSNLDFFINFEKYFPHPARTDLTKNYRSIKSIVDAGAFIIKKNKQIQKQTIADSQEIRPILVYSSLHEKQYYAPYLKQIAKHCLEKIKQYHTTKNYRYDDFMILLRITKNYRLMNYINQYAEELGIPITDKLDRPDCVHILSVHKSKGLQARIIIILNVDDDLYGFPCQLEDPDIFEIAIKNNDGFREQEERRLFYVAVTRAKEEVIMYTQKCSESKFITEIKEFTKREELDYKSND